jgi:protein gp37
LLLETPAAVRWISAEPLLGPVEFSNVSGRADAVKQLGKQALAGIDWVVVGGESGPGARACDIGWIRSIVSQCKAVHVPVFVKQLGAQPFEPARYEIVGDAGLYLNNRKGGEMNEWPEDLRIREFPEVMNAKV